MRSARWVVAFLALALLALAVAPAAATTDAGRGRHGGVDRFATAAAVARAAFPDGTDTALLARADIFSDALAAGALAGLRSAPILLTSSDALPDVTARALDHLGVETVHVLGGDAAVGPAVRRAIEDAGMGWVRYQGRDRYETAALVAQQVATEAGIGSLGGARTVLLASGTRFPDALAAAPVGYAARFPVLLTDGAALPDLTRTALTELDVAQVLVVGGTAAVPRSVEEQLVALGFHVRRIAGVDRFATAMAVADLARDELGFPATEVVLTRGDGFADALAAGPYAGSRRAPLLLTYSPTTLGTRAATWTWVHCERVAQVTAVGGVAALAETVLDEAERNARRCGFDLVAPYFLMSGERGSAGLVPVQRRVVYDGHAFPSAIEALLAGPTDAERTANRAITTAIPSGTRLNHWFVRDGVATLDFSGRFDDGAGSASMFGRLAQVVYTATAFPGVDGVVFQLEGRPVELFSSEGILLDGAQTRKDYVDQLPNLLVETPPYGGWLGNPASLSGLATVFEAQFAYELRDAGGEVVAEGFVLALDAVRGSFAATIPYEVPTRQPGTLWVFNHSARDGSVENLRVYPVELTPSSLR